MSLAEEGNSALAMSARPMRDLVLLLPRLQVGKSLELDYAGSDAALLQRICANAEATLDTILLGLASMGMLLANCTPEIETGDVAPNAIEQLGWLTAELGEFAAALHVLAAAGRRYVDDDLSDEDEVVEGVKL